MSNNNNLTIDAVPTTLEVSGITNSGTRLYFDVSNLESYGGPKNSEVYTLTNEVSMNKLINLGKKI